MLQKGKCKYCDQMFMIDNDEELTEEELSIEATRQCNCSLASNSRIRETKKCKVKENINQLFGMDEATAIILIENIDRIACDNIASITVDSGAGYKGKMYMTSKGAIKVERNVSKKISMEEQYE